MSTQGPIITFAPDDRLGDHLGFNKTTIYEKYNLSTNPVHILSFDTIIIDIDNARGIYNLLNRNYYQGIVF